MDRQAFLREHAPCYVYDQAMIAARCRELREALPDVAFLYSVKSNPFPGVLREIARQGFGADAASAREVTLSLENGIAPEAIFYSAPGKTDADIAGSVGSCVITADSLLEIRRLDRAAKARGEVLGIGLRVNPDFSMEGPAGGASKFGVDVERMPELAALLRECGNVRLRGLHLHIRSQVLEERLLGRYYRNCLRLAERVADLTGARLEFLNFGSGIGTVYDPARECPLDLARLGELVAEVARENERTLGAKLYIETGRFVTCGAGTYYTPVVDIKESCGKKFLIVPNGMNGFLRPSVACVMSKCGGQRPVPSQEPLYTHDRAYAVRVLNDAAETETVTVAGNLCTALDVICEDEPLNRAEVGDLVEVTNAGSYAYTLSPLLFASHPLPGQYLLTENGGFLAAEDFTAFPGSEGAAETGKE